MIPLEGMGHPAYEALRSVIDSDRLAHADLAGLQAVLDGASVTNANGELLRVCAPMSEGAQGYERDIYTRGALAVRADTWHDRFNVAAWRLFPRSKAALNAAHIADLDAAPAHAGRSRLRDTLTLFDEDGIVVAVSDPAIEAAIRAFRWREVFWEKRAGLIAGAVCIPFGHALMEKLRAPFIGLTAKALFVHVPGTFPDDAWAVRLACVDGALSRIIGGLRTPADLAPLPVLGLPGWCPQSASAAFYDNADYFRPGRRGKIA
jgi:hypothetical protein